MIAEAPMPEITIKATITPDHKLHADVPEDTPVGDVEVVIRPVPAKGGNARAVAGAMLKAAKAVKNGRTKEEIDADLAALRDEWD
jgi:hypothetical protein